MTVWYRPALLLTALGLLGLAGVLTWLFVYTGDLPDVEHLCNFAPNVQSLVADSCLESPSFAVPFDHIGTPLRASIAAAELRPEALWHASLSDKIASTLMCLRSGGAGRYHLDSFRLSFRVRMRFSKDQQFAIFANRAYIGAGITGVESAAQQFFRASSDTLSAEQAALIAGLLRAPDRFSPYKHPDKALQRRNDVLEILRVQGKLSDVEATRAKATPLGLAARSPEL